MIKKILYISYDGMTDPLGQSQVLPYLCKLAAMGYEFTLLSFEKKDRYKKSSPVIEAICKANNIRWAPAFFSKRPPLLSKLYDGWKMKKKAAQLYKEHRFAFTHCRSYVAAAAGLSLFKQYNIPFLFDMRGFWVDERVDNGQWNLGNPLYKAAYTLYKKKEKEYFSKSAHIISLTEKGKEELAANYGVALEKVSVIPCCADLEHFDYNKVNELEKENLKTRIGINKGDKILSYLGSLGGWYLTDEMLDFFKVLKQYEPAAKFLFITHDSRGGIVAKAVARGLEEKDIITEPAARQQVPLFLSLSNWSVFFIKDAYSKKASSPTKQGEIMAMGVPIICNDIGDTGRIVATSGTGLVIHSFSEEAYKEAALKFSKLDSINKESIRAAAFRYYDLNNGAHTYAEVYKNILQ
jgi:glycosyltransferase involved in cell wall biosynthesis